MSDTTAAACAAIIIVAALAIHAIIAMINNYNPNEGDNYGDD